MGGEEESQLADVLKHLSGIHFVYCMLILGGTEAQFVNIFRHKTQFIHIALAPNEKF